MSSLSISVIENAGIVVVRLAGEGSFRMVDCLDTPFKRIVATHPPRVVFDLAGLEFAASLFLGALVRLRKDLGQHGGQVQLAAARPNIIELLEVTRLAQFFEFIPAAPDLPPVEPS